MSDKLIRGTQHHSCRFTEQEVRDIRAEYIPGVNGYDRLAKARNCNRATISKIVRGVSWKHLE